MATKKQKLQKRLAEKILAVSNEIEKHKESSANYIVLSPNFINKCAKNWKTTSMTARHHLQIFLGPPI